MSRVDEVSSIAAEPECCCQNKGASATLSPCVRRTNWRDIAAGYPQPQECLAAYLTLAAAEVVAGVKPASLVRLSRRSRACGRNMYALWQSHSSELLQSCRVEFFVLREDSSGLLLLIYAPTLLQRRLRSRCAVTFLRKFGYDRAQDVDCSLELLRRRFQSMVMPHEVGVFLGYPLKDVAAFSGRIRLAVSAQRLWKIYGNSRRSEQLADLYQRHHAAVAALLRHHAVAATSLLKCS